MLNSAPLFATGGSSSGSTISPVGPGTPKKPKRKDGGKKRGVSRCCFFASFARPVRDDRTVWYRRFQLRVHQFAFSCGLD